MPIFGLLLFTLFIAPCLCMMAAVEEAELCFLWEIQLGKFDAGILHAIALEADQNAHPGDWLCVLVDELHHVHAPTGTATSQHSRWLRMSISNSS